MRRSPRPSRRKIGNPTNRTRRSLHEASRAIRTRATEAAAARSSVIHQPSSGKRRRADRCCLTSACPGCEPRVPGQRPGGEADVRFVSSLCPFPSVARVDRSRCCPGRPAGRAQRSLTPSATIFDPTDGGRCVTREHRQPEPRLLASGALNS